MTISNVFMKVHYSFSTVLWQHHSTNGGGWHFLSLPKKISDEIRYCFQSQEEGWGRMKVNASIKELFWNTSIWFDSKQGLYLLPIKADIRKKLKLIPGDLIEIVLWIP